MSKKLNQIKFQTDWRDRLYCRSLELRPSQIPSTPTASTQKSGAQGQETPKKEAQAKTVEKAGPEVLGGSSLERWNWIISE